LRKLYWIVGILAVLWSGYWALGTYALRQGAYQAIAEATRNGNFISPDIASAGFPTSFDITLERLDIGSAESGLRWETPSLRLQAAAWRPWHLVALLDDQHSFAMATEDITLSVDDARASLTVTPDSSLTLSQLAVTLIQPMVQSSRAWKGSADLAEVQVNLLPNGPANSYAVVADAINTVLDPTFVAATGLDRTISRIDLDATLSFSAPIDRHAGATKPQITAVTLQGLKIEWGQVVLSADGSITADTDGLAKGRIDLTVQGWRRLVPAMVGIGAITPEVAPSVTGFLNAMAAQGGDPETLAIPLVYQNGVGTFGPIPLGPAPRLIAP
jgi:hypothetical protein